MKPTDKQRREINRYIKKWQPRLKLQEWRITVKHAPPSGTYLASCAPCSKYLDAVIRIYPSFWEETKKEREEVIVHELAHCISDEVNEALIVLCNGRVVTRENIETLNERLTQRITNIVFNDEWDV